MGVCGGSSIPPPDELQGQQPPQNGYFLAPGANRVSAMSMPDWTKSYNKGAEQMLPVIMNDGGLVMKVTCLMYKQGTFETWQFSKVEGQICQVQDADGTLVCVIAPEAAPHGTDFPQWNVREVVHTAKPTFARQSMSIQHNGIPLYLFARAQKAPITGGFRGTCKTHLHMAMNTGSGFNAQPSFEWYGGHAGTSAWNGYGTISDCASQAPIATVERARANSIFTFGPGVDACLMILFSVANLKHTKGCDQNTP